MNKVIDDLEKLTNVKNSTLMNMLSCINYIILDDVIEQTSIGNDVIELDVGIGVLSIYLIDDTLEYSFKPSQKLENGLIKAINEKENPLEEKLAESINKNIYKVYKDML